MPHEEFSQQSGILSTAGALKPIKHHGNMVPRGLYLELKYNSNYDEKKNILDFTFSGTPGSMKLP